MKSRILIQLALVWGLAGTVIAQDQAPGAVESAVGDRVEGAVEETASGSAYAAETMEHVEATAYPVPELIAEEEVSDNRYLIQEQHREQYRQEMLRDPNREALLNNVRSVQQQQVEALMRAAEEQLAQQQAPQESPQQTSAQEALETTAADPVTTEQAPAAALTQSVSEAPEAVRESSLAPAVLPEQEADREAPANEIQREQNQESVSEQEPS
uniref:hypothetical protein n=1 Tax=Microbulbifer agarilyticus TaxID=260552 RepID=UPI000255B64F|nr:hypothetical protein [Microbulbifer agarilyticus]